MSLKEEYILIIEHKIVVFDYILPIHFMILYNTTGMSHLKATVGTSGATMKEKYIH